LVVVDGTYRVGLVETHKVLGALSVFPEKPAILDPLQSMPPKALSIASANR